ncbi:glutamine synthetase [Cryobacterium sp. TMT2-18-3]|uniref:glutamine synthetase n=1 Tax=unclassified Cryobacterium TaxID=2649013 RepID=UPI00106D3F28|nr:MULTISPECIES: glutamine synthetase [unclassified Cryobacterium]TFC30644.1 glutamine synthetase [Cryobacterium sp. TMT2-18-2]TFC61119.1 glutamine synthetase [Cryobacterium sp. TMT2-18-3]
MATESILPEFSDCRIGEVAERLSEAGVGIIVGTLANPAGIYLAKTIPVDRLATFASSGLGAPPVWNIFCIDGGIALTPDLGVVGDMRLRLDLDALRILDGGLAWAPTEIFDQNGAPLAIDPRGRLRRIQHDIEEAGLEALVGHEIEFTITAADGTPLPRAGWTPYGLGPVLDHEAFITELLSATAAAGIPLEQLHAKFFASTVEFSLPPATPLQAADEVVLARLITGRLARKHNLRVSFSPFPISGGGGNAAHVHYSFSRNGEPLFSGGDGPHGMTTDGASSIAGVIAALPGIQGVLGGSILSGARLRPRLFSGAYACWGRENRGAAVRFLEATRGNPQGANVEIKIVDPSSNPYLTTAVILGAALEGIRSSTVLPAEVTANPADQTEEQQLASATVLLPSALGATLDALAASELAAYILGPQIIQAVLAVRRWELDHYGSADADQLPEKFRFAWSI